MGERRRRGAAVLAVGAVLFGVAVPTAASASSAGATLQASTTTAAHGDVVTFEGTCPDGMTRASVSLGPQPPVPPTSSTRHSSPAPFFATGVSVQVAADGSFAGALVVAVDLTPGEGYRLSLTCWSDAGGGGGSAGVPFTVEASDPPATPNQVALPTGTRRPGEALRVTGTALLAPGHPATRGTALLWREGPTGDSLAQRWRFTIADDGTFAADLPIPAATRPGDHRFELHYEAGPQTFGGDQVTRIGLRGPRFRDVPADSPHAAAIAALSDHGVTVGCGGGRFCPDAPIARDQFASLLHRATERSAVGGAPPFRDVARDSVHAPAIATLAANGTIAGCDTDRFCPTATLRRDQTVSLLVRDRFDWVEPSRRPFRDVPADSRHADAIGSAHAIGLARGCAPARFCPRDPVTRAQAASFLARAYGWVD